MKISIAITFFILLTCCNSEKKTNSIANNDTTTREVKYPEMTAICFNGDNAKYGRAGIINLGDTLRQVLKFIQLNYEDQNKYPAVLHLKEPIIHKEKFGTIITQIATTFDENKRLESFEANFTFKGDTTKENETLFSTFVIQKNLLPCFWEGYPDFQKPIDTINIRIGNCRNRLTYDFQSTNWQINYGCKLF